MITTSYRELTVQERERLKGMVAPEPARGCREWFLGVIFFLIGGIEAGAMLVTLPFSLPFSPSISDKTALSLLLLGALAGLLVGARLFFHPEIDQSRRCRKYLPDLRRGLAEITRYEVQAAVGIQDRDYEDFTTGYFLDAGERLLVYLEGCGQDEQEPFPTRVIEATRAPHSRMLLNLSTSGEPVPMLRRAPLTYDEYHPKDGEVLLGTLDTLGDDLRRMR